MPPHFVSPGAAAGNAIQQLLVERALQQRQAMLDQFTRETQQRETEQRERGLGLQEQQLGLAKQTEGRIAEAQAQAATDAEHQRAFTRANTIAENAIPGDAVDEATRALLTEQGFGGQISKVPGILSQGPMTEAPSEANGGIPTYGVVQAPDQFKMRGGSKYMAARVAADERAAEAEKNRVAAAERADADRQMRELIARMSASNSAETRGLANELKQLQINQLQDKIDSAAKEKADKVTAVKSGREKIRGLAQGLIDDAALESITGPIEGRRDTFLQGQNVDALKRLNQLINSLSVEERSKLKGQGQVSDYEGRMLASSVSAIDRAAGSKFVEQHLKEIVDAFQGDMPRNGPPSDETDALLDELLKGNGGSH